MRKHRNLAVKPFAIMMAYAFCTMAAQAADKATTDADNLPEVSVKAKTTRPDALPEAYAGGQVARGGRIGVLGNQDSMDVPFSMTSYTAKTIQDQQAQTLADVLLNDPSVRSGYGFGNYAETFVIRGFTLEGDDIGFNGLYGITPRQLVATENLERVEVLKGASAFLNGASPQGSGLGGTVNIVSKRADDTPLTRGTLSYGANNQVGGHVDFGRRFGADNQFGIRLNAVQRDGDTAIKNESRRLSSAAIGWDFRGDALRLSADVIYQKQTARQARAVVFFNGPTSPSAPKSNTNYAQSWEGTQLEDTVAMARAEYDFSKNLMGYLAVGAKKTNESGDYASPRVDGNGVGTAARLGVNFAQESVSSEAGLRGIFETGPVKHRVNLGVTSVNIENRNAFDFSGSYATNIYNTPVVANPAAISTPASGGNLNDPQVTANTHRLSVALSNTLAVLDDRVLLTVGLRRQNLNQTTYSSGSQAITSDYDQSITTPVYGIVIKPADYLSLYANSIQGLVAGDIAPAVIPGTTTPVANALAALAPFKSKQKEVGAKVDFGKFGGGVAVFEIERASSVIVGNVFTNGGEQRNRGIEFNGYGEPVSGWRVLGGAAFTDAELSKTQDGLNDGNTAPGVAKSQYNLASEFDISDVPGLTLTGRWVRTGSQYVNASNTLSIPKWDRFDIGARYATLLNQHAVIFRANVENLFDKDYWASVSSTAGFGQVTQGLPRLIRLSATIDF